MKCCQPLKDNPPPHWYLSSFSANKREIDYATLIGEGVKSQNESELLINE